MEVRIKRAYDAPAATDGYRALVDRLWPRGRSKVALRLDTWLKDVAPSDDLRTWFGHDPARWVEFKRRYRRELRASGKRELVRDLSARARRGTLTLVYGAKDTEHNEAVVLKSLIERIST